MTLLGKLGKVAFSSQEGEKGVGVTTSGGNEEVEMGGFH